MRRRSRGSVDCLLMERYYVPQYPASTITSFAVAQSVMGMHLRRSTGTLTFPVCNTASGVTELQQTVSHW